MVRMIFLSCCFVAESFAQFSETKLTASDGTEYDIFGHSVSISGDYAIIGAPWDDHVNSSGSAYIFRREDSVWIEQIKLVDPTANQFGFSVSISGDYAIVSALGDVDVQYAGVAYIYHRDGGSWVKQAEITPPGILSDDSFGVSVSISGDFAIVGAHRDSARALYAGSAYIYMRNGAEWYQHEKLTARDGSEGDSFGVGVDLFGEYAIVTAPNDDTWRGSAYIFVRDGENWIEEVKIMASDGSQHDGFGASVSLDGEYAIIGADYDTVDGVGSGSAYIFKREGRVWNQQAKLTPSPGGRELDQFGHSVSISGSYAIVGSGGDDAPGFNAGRAFLYEREGSSWNEVQRFSASDVSIEDGFGYSVFIDGPFAIIGSGGNDEVAYNSGATYLYTGFYRPPGPNLRLPPNGALVTTDSLVLVWSRSNSDVDRYWMEKDEDSLFASPIIDSLITDTVRTVYSLQSGQTYYWRVRAHNFKGWGPFSEVWSFSVLITGVGGHEEIPIEFSLSQNYPNPFNPSTVIRYGLPERAHVRLEVFNLLGQSVAVLVDAEKEAGWHEVELGGSEYSSGVFFYRLEAGSWVMTKKLLMLR